MDGQTFILFKQMFQPSAMADNAAPKQTVTASR
jgi:hypothetical protein